jgi:predicted metal-binding protein
MTTEILVCTTCRPAGASRDMPAAGELLWNALQDITLVHPLPPGVRMRPFACLNSCSRACTVAFQAAGKHTYCFGDLQPDAATAAEVVDCALLHARSGDGNMPRSDRPERLRGGILMRLPPLVDATEAAGPSLDIARPG